VNQTVQKSGENTSDKTGAKSKSLKFVSPFKSEVFAFNTTNIFSCVPPPPVALQKFISHHNLQMLRRATVKALQASTGHLSEKQPSIT
jgi:hypothetical protein